MYNNKEKIIYHIYPLGFCGAPDKNDFHSQTVDRINKIYDWIPHMKELGVTSLYLGPVFESVEHGYDTVDYFKVDRRLGTNESLKNLVRVLHENGIEVILDAVFNHVGREHFAFRDIKQHRENSQYKHWFNGLRFDRDNPCHDGFDYNTWDGHYNLVKLNLHEYDVSQHLLYAAKFWIEEFDIDGLRLDAADVLDFTFMRDLSNTCKHLKNDFWLMGEVVHGDYRRWINEANLDSVTNYECYKGFYSSHNDKNYFEIAYSLRRQFSNGGIYSNIPLYNFADNHDVNRISSALFNQAHLFPLYTLIFTAPGVPSVYYGSEWAVKGYRGGYNDKELRPVLDPNYREKNCDLFNHISNLSKIRKELNPLKYGSYRECFVSSEQFIFERDYNGEKIVIILNSSEKMELLPASKIPSGNYIDILNQGETINIYPNSKIKIYPSWCRILKKVA